MKARNGKEVWDIRITGLVQGVGFRPFIHNLAKANTLTGWVMNRNDCVVVKVQGTSRQLSDFVQQITEKAPTAAFIETVEVEILPETPGYRAFRILDSKNISSGITEISPDIAVCQDCLHDMKHLPRRLNYPFINCTNCGPRFTIIRDLPYDRHNTTMTTFQMCGECRMEYDNPADRRFHAQPVACRHCGPSYTLHFNGNTIHDQEQILAQVASLLRNGSTVAIKGMGGFHLACDATNEQAVSRLRKRKMREGKPFAVMFANKETAKEYVFMNRREEDALSSWRRPVVLLRTKKQLAPSVNNGFARTGAMLPYMPFHYLLFEKLNLPAIVLTSGNISDEPIIIDDAEAVERFRTVADATLCYNRGIFNRVDDSVTILVNGSLRIIRRSRGYAPAPIRLKLNVEGIFAAGAELVNCFCIGRGHKAFLSQHIGDLKNMETLDFYRESAERFSCMFRISPVMVAHDLHPDYLSTRFARELGIPAIAIQHHHAHIASCMAENGLNEKIIGVCFDGTGLGDDGNIWGGEFFICDLETYERVAHLEYTPMPGGDKGATEPWRMAVSYLLAAYGESFQDLDLPFLRQIRKDHLSLVIAAIQKKINSPMTSSAGRLFDAASAILNLCGYAAFHAEAPMRLEAALSEGETGEFPFHISPSGIISFKETIKALTGELIRGAGVDIISAKFHNTIISAIFNSALFIRSASGLKKIALSGGVFQNRYLSEKTEKKLKEHGFEVYAQRLVPANDGGLALGQIAIAAAKSGR